MAVIRPVIPADTQEKQGTIIPIPGQKTHRRTGISAPFAETSLIHVPIPLTIPATAIVTYADT